MDYKKKQGFRYRGTTTRRHWRNQNAVTRGRGEKTNSGTFYVTGCPFCWHWSTVRKQNEPFPVKVSGDTKKATCPAGHTWRVV